MSDSNLYSQEFLHYYKNPAHKGKLSNSSKHSKVSNLSCGDAIEVYLEIDGGFVKKASYEGVGCIVSLASAEMLCENIEQKSIEEVRSLTQEHFLSEIGFDLTPSRQKCALISYKALRNLIDEK